MIAKFSGLTAFPAVYMSSVIIVKILVAVSTHRQLRGSRREGEYLLCSVTTFSGLSVGSFNADSRPGERGLYQESRASAEARSVLRRLCSALISRAWSVYCCSRLMEASELSEATACAVPSWSGAGFIIASAFL